MTDTLDAALDRVVTAARGHLAAVRDANGESDDGGAVWRAYLALTRATREYDEALNRTFGEVTPWEVDELSTAEEDFGHGLVATSAEPAEVERNDPYPQIVSVRQRRDYRVPSVSALLRVLAASRPSAPLEPPNVAEALLQLIRSGDGTLGMLDLFELEPISGVVVVAEVATPLDPDVIEVADGVGPFRLQSNERVVGRLDDRALLDRALLDIEA